jgi:hypothetical protein
MSSDNTALRECGDLLIGIALLADSEHYLAVIWHGRKALHELTGLRRSPHHSRIYAADSEHAFDVVAQAAMSFASWENDDVYAYGEQDEHGNQWLIRR